MKKLALIFFLLTILISAQSKVSVTFRVTASSVADSEGVFIVGSIPEFGNWNASKAPLDKVSKNIWQKTFQLDKNTLALYKFTKGNWLFEALTDSSTIPSNSILKVNADTTINVVINKWRDGSNFKIIGQITGKVEYVKNFEIEGLKPRNLIIWFPPGYKKNADKRYPVIYMQDGQNLFDPKTSTGFVDWRADETADSLIRRGKIKPVIIVGIYNTEDRSAEYTDTPKGHLYMKGIVEKIKPFIDSKYRTLTGRNNTAVAGSSLGGLISMMCAWEYPEVFSKAACFSPAFKIDTIDYVKNVLNYTWPKKNLMFYIDNGGIDLDARLLPGVDAMVTALKQKGYKENKDFYVYIDKAATHNEAAWAKRFWRPLKLFFGAK